MILVVSMLHNIDFELDPEGHFRKEREYRKKKQEHFSSIL